MSGWSRRTVLALAAGFALPASAEAQAVLVPPRGSPLRAALLDAFRASVSARIGGPVEFEVSALRVLRDWAYVSARPRRPGGAPIDWAATPFAEAMRADAMSDLTLGLLRRSGGVWRVVETAIGPTDVAWIDWIARHRAPRAVFSDE